MNAPLGIGMVRAPTHTPKEFLAYESECRRVLKPAMTGLIDMAEAAGWNRRTVMSTLMFLAAQELSSTSGKPAAASAAEPTGR